MKPSVFITLAMSLVPVCSYLETSASVHDSLKGQVLFRRGSPKQSAGRSGTPLPSNQPIARPGNQPHRSQSPQSADTQNPQRSHETPPLGNLFGGQSRPRQQRGSPRPPHSDGDSDSSEDDANRRLKAKTKVIATGPGMVEWMGSSDDFGMKQLAQNQRFKHSVRGDSSDMTVRLENGNPPGKAKVNMRGQKKLSVFVSSEDGGRGKITPVEPAGTPVHVEENDSEHQVIRAPRGTRATYKSKSELQGPGIIRALASG